MQRIAHLKRQKADLEHAFKQKADQLTSTREAMQLEAEAASATEARCLQALQEVSHLKSRLRVALANAQRNTQQALAAQER